jgi:hypothetical protein
VLHIPVPNLSDLVNLKALFLIGNRFSGPFSASLTSLGLLRSINLSENQLYGTLPPCIGGCAG